MRCAALCLLLLAPPAAAHAARPDLKVILPVGFQRGTEVEVRFTGSRLGDAQELMFYSPGVEVRELVAEKDDAVKARLAIAGDCRLGIHALRLRTATGLSDLRTFSVGALPEVAEQEPNNELAAAQAIPLDVTVSGVVQDEDVDCFAIEAKKGERIVAELEGVRLGYTFFDPSLAILNSARFELARSDDAPLLRQDPVCALIAPEDGKYVIQVRESAYGGNGSCFYRLHAGRFPRPTAVMPAGGKPGETLSVQWIGDPAGNWTEQIVLPAVADPKLELFARDAAGVAPSPNIVRVADLENAIEAEPNNAREQATAAAAPGAMNGVIQEPGDVDFFRFAAKKGQQFDLRVHARQPLRSPLDSVLVVRKADGSAVGSNDDSGGPDSYLKFAAPDDGDYFVEVTDHLRSGGADFVYRVEAVPVLPSLTMSLPEREQYVATTLVVPRGNRMALMVNANRANWGGDLTVSFAGLPAGVAFQTVTMTGGLNAIPVLFTAAADAPLAGQLVDVVGRPADTNLEIVGHLEQRSMLVRGQNNRDVWGFDAQRMVSAVTEAAPFELEIVPPKAPLARQGAKPLKVVARRKEGFNEPIAIRLLYNPPGIGSSGSITIEKDQNEAAIPLTANGSAEIGRWPILVTGSATVGNGPVEVASQLAELEVAESFFGFTFEKAAGEQGQGAQVVVNIETRVPYEGEAQIQLLGLPANTTTSGEPQKINQDTDRVAFPVTIAADARPGVHKSLVCRAVVFRDGEEIEHTIGSGELRIDPPLPAPAAAAPPPAQANAPPQPAAPAPKQLSRLEQLRQQQQQGGTPP